MSELRFVSPIEDRTQTSTNIWVQDGTISLDSFQEQPECSPTDTGESDITEVCDECYVGNIHL